MIDSVVFDFDGVIIDTETPQFKTWSEVFHEHGVKLDRRLWQKIIGGGTVRFDAFEHLQNLAGRDLNRDIVFESKSERYAKRIRESPTLPGVERYIEDARKLGFKIGVASSSSKEWVEGLLESRGLLRYFDCVVCRDHVENVKPNPELYLKAISLLGSSPERAVAIEDSYNGLTSAKNAGMYCIVVTNPMTKDMIFDRADFKLDALSEISLEDLVGIMGVED
tara:strand:- start:36 stop:701 length:666 start_codon:yes stop_codon:yes gene_type:complete